MTQEDLYNALSSLNVPVAYSEFEEETAPPFITYQFTESADIMADNQNYLDVGNFQIELYTKKKDIALENAVQSKLKELNLAYSKFEAYIESEKLRQIVYKIQIVGG